MFEGLAESGKLNSENLCQHEWQNVAKIHTQVTYVRMTGRAWQKFALSWQTGEDSQSGIVHISRDPILSGTQLATPHTIKGMKFLLNKHIFQTYKGTNVEIKKLQTFSGGLTVKGGPLQTMHSHEECRLLG
jgi:hypothetical protein